MKTFRLIISSPEGDIFDSDAVSVSLRGVEGDLAIMAGHIPFVTAIRPGSCSVEFENEIKEATLDGGILNVSNENVRIMAGSFKWKE